MGKVVIFRDINCIRAHDLRPQIGEGGAGGPHQLHPQGVGQTALANGAAALVVVDEGPVAEDGRGRELDAVEVAPGRVLVPAGGDGKVAPRLGKGADCIDILLGQADARPQQGPIHVGNHQKIADLLTHKYLRSGLSGPAKRR